MRAEDQKGEGCSNQGVEESRESMLQELFLGKIRGK